MDRSDLDESHWGTGIGRSLVMDALRAIARLARVEIRRTPTLYDVRRRGGVGVDSSATGPDNLRVDGARL